MNRQRADHGTAQPSGLRRANSCGAILEGNHVRRLHSASSRQAIECTETGRVLRLGLERVVVWDDELKRVVESCERERGVDIGP